MSRATKVMSHIIGVRKKADSQKGVRKAADSQKRGPQSKKFGNLCFSRPDLNNSQSLKVFAALTIGVLKTKLKIFLKIKFFRVAASVLIKTEGLPLEIKFITICSEYK